MDAYSETAGRSETPNIAGATQRIYINTETKPDTGSVNDRRAEVHARSNERRAAAARQKKRRQRIVLISICAVAALVLLAVIMLLVSLSNKASTTEDVIHSNVFAAGVDLSGLTESQAKSALHDATDRTYDTLDMNISILGTVYTLSPTDTGASLDVDAVVSAAMALTDSGTVSILPYLNLNTDYIQSFMDELSVTYGTALSQTTYEIVGEAPSMKQDTYDTSKAYQTLYVYIGTAEYGLNTDALYQQIMDAYEINLFEVSCQCSVVAPDALYYEGMYTELCTPPVNASFDSTSYEVTPEVYGYGFTIEELQTAVDGAAYGSTVEVPMHFIQPDITSDFYSEEMLQDTLAYYTTDIPDIDGWETNLKQACNAIDGTIIKAGETFSFNSATGLPTESKGYKGVEMYLGKTYQEVIGGGISQLASMLYYCALTADLNVIERNSCTYAPSYIQAGFDAEVSYGTMDLRFKNTTDQPIRIDASVSNGMLSVTLVGTDNNDYYVRLSYNTDATYKSQAVYTTMLPDNAGGYVDGNLLSNGCTGYLISTYALKYDASNNRLISETLIAQSYYEKRDTVFVKIYEEPVIEDPDPTDPSVTDPSDPSDVTDPSDPAQTDPSETTPDESTPDESIPDESTPDESTPDESVPEESTIPEETTSDAQG